MSVQKRALLGRVAIIGLLAVAVASPAHAQVAGGDIGGFIQNIIDFFNDKIIRGLAVLAVIFVGGAWLLGHLDLRRAATVVLGIVVMFSGAAIVDLIVGGA